MDKVEHVKPNFPAEAFAGTAAYYSRYRAPYPKILLTDLLSRSGVTGKGRLLDLACGPGRVGLALAPSFEEIWAVDLEGEMIEEGKKEAARLGVRNIKWITGRAEDLAAPPASFELIAIGEAFHRLDQQLVAIRALQWLRSRGCVATLGCDTILSGTETWQRVVTDVVHQWRIRGILKSDSSPRKPGSGPEHNERVLRGAGFLEVASYSWIIVHEWSIEAIVGYLFSTSVCSKAVFGGDTRGFESELKAALLAHEPSGVYRENTLWGYTIGRKPS